ASLSPPVEREHGITRRRHRPRRRPPIPSLVPSAKHFQTDRPVRRWLVRMSRSWASPDRPPPATPTNQVSIELPASRAHSIWPSRRTTSNQQPFTSDLFVRTCAL